MALENSDDDISVLSHQDLDEVDANLSGGVYHGFQFLPTSPNCHVDKGPEVALRKAYDTLKLQYNVILADKQKLAKALKLKNKEMEAYRGYKLDSSVDIDNERSMNAQGAAAMPEGGSNADIGALQGYIRSLEKRLMVAGVHNESLKSQLQSFVDSNKLVEKKYRTSQEEKESFHHQVESLMKQLQTERDNYAQLQQENNQLRTQLRESESKMRMRTGEAESKEHAQMQQKNRELMRKCEQLEKEKDTLKALLKRAQLTLQDMKEVTDIPSNSSLPAADELLQLKAVIASLKKIVLQQREFLGSLGRPNLPAVPSKLGSKIVSPRPSLSEDGTDSIGTKCVNSRHSWEPVQMGHTDKRMMTGGQVHLQKSSSSFSGDSAQWKNRVDDVKLNIPSFISADMFDGDADRQGTVPQYMNNVPPVLPDSRQGMQMSQSEVIQRNHAAQLNPLRRHQSDVLARGRGHSNSGSVSEPLSPRLGREHLRPVENSCYEEVNGNPPVNVNQGNDRPWQQDAEKTPAASRQNVPSENLAQGLDQTLSNRSCPVCCVDFSHLTMEDFQTHVFECFDDEEHPPETLQPSVNRDERICPMCNALFPSAVSQDDFERHVQAHFGDDIPSQFEVLHS